jgi:hypothetical protein
VVIVCKADESSHELFFGNAMLSSHVLTSHVTDELVKVTCREFLESPVG